MSNLSDLKAAGGSGKSIELVASGALSNGDKVVLNTDGTVSLPVDQSLDVTTQSNYQAGAMRNNASAYDAGENKIISAFVDDIGSNGLQVKLGSLSGTTVTWQTRVTAYGTNFNPAVPLSMASDGNGTFVIVFDKADGTTSRMHVVVGTISGTTVTMGTPVSLGTSNYSGLSVSYDANAAKFIVFYAGVSSYGTGVVLSISSTTPTINTPVVFRSDTGGRYASAYDSVSQKVGLFYFAGTANISGQAVTISGSTPSYGTAANLSNYIGAESYMQPDGTFDSDTGQCVFVFRQDTGGKGVAVTMKITGTASSFGTSVEYTTGTDRCNWPSVSYDSLAKKVVIINDTGDNLTGDYIIGTVSGTAITVATAVQFTASETKLLATVFDSTAGKSVFTYINESISDDMHYVVLANAAQTFSSFVGISEGAFADTATATVMLRGGITTTQSGLTIGSTYYVQADGTLSTTADSPSVVAGQALSATTLLIEGET